MPRRSSGSSMGVSASIISSGVGKVISGMVLSLRVAPAVPAGEALAQDVPGEGRALDAHGEAAHALERLQVPKHFRRLRIWIDHHLLERRRQGACLLDGLSLHRPRHHRARRLADRAATAPAGDIADHAVFEVNLDLDLIAAKGVIALRPGVGVSQGLTMPGAAVVIEDQLSVELIQLWLRDGHALSLAGHLGWLGREEAPGFAQGLYESVDLRRGVVKEEAGPRRRHAAQPGHQRLSAVVARPDGGAGLA